MVMLQSFSFCSVSLFLPVGICLFWSKQLRLHRKVTFPMGVILSAGYQALFAAWLHKVMPYGVAKWAVAMGGSTLLVWGSLLLVVPSVANVGLSRREYRKVWIPLLLIGLFFCLENLLILGKQGWTMGPMGTAYFRPPFQNDGQRHVILVNALLRGGEAPFLPGEKLTYQLFWYHWTALFAGLFKVKTLYPVVQGAIGATSCLFIFSLLWTLVRLYPIPFARGGIFFLIPLMGIWHSDLYNFLATFLLTKQPGIEADWSAIPTFFRYFSVTLVALTAPQHAFFFVFLAALLGVRHVRMSPIRCRFDFTAIEWGLVLFCLLSSPVMSLFFFPVYALSEMWRLRRSPMVLAKTAFAFIGAVCLLYGMYPTLFGFDFLDLFLRPGNPPLEWGASLREWIFFPVLWVNIAGMMGALSLVVFFLNFRNPRLRKKLISWETLVFFLGAIIFYYVATGIEIRRHFSMITGFSGLFFLLAFLPTGKSWRQSLVGKGVMGVTVITSLLLHGYFLYCYLGKPTHFKTQLAWDDYFQMNEVVRDRFPELPVLAAVDIKGLGLDYPIIMEATTSFSATYHTAVHVKLNAEKMRTLTAMEFSGEVVPFGARLGYQAILWGPVEERAWGKKVKERFVSERQKLATTGSVSLYRLSDSWRDYFLEETKKSGEVHFRLAESLLKAGWNGEALEHFQTLLEENPNLAKAYFGMGKAFEQVGKYSLALDYFTRTVQIDPKFTEAAFAAGILFRGLGRMEEAQRAFEFAIRNRPEEPSHYRELAALFFWRQEYGRAEAVLKRALEATSERSQMMVLLGEVKKAQANQGKL